MLADKTAAMEDQLREAQEIIATLQSDLETARANPVTVEVAVVPPEVADTMAELAARAEAIVQKLDEID
jgi:cell division protein ZapA